MDIENGDGGFSIEEIQKVIGYIEEHLLESLTLSKIATQFYVNSTSLNIMFRLTTGLTMMEYVKNRRLTLASQELLTTRNTIIMIALKYQYETPEAFTKAFTRMNGFPPSYVRRMCPSMKQFLPIHFHVQMTGGWMEEQKLTDSIVYGTDTSSDLRYHIDDKSKGGHIMRKQVMVHTKEMKETKDWLTLLHLAESLKKAEILYKVDGKTMIFAHGLEFPLDKICLTFLRGEEEAVKRFFGVTQETREASSHFRYFDAVYEGMKIRCMFYGAKEDPENEEDLYRNADLVEVDGLMIYVQSLEFYYENAKPSDFFYEKVEEYLNVK